MIKKLSGLGLLFVFLVVPSYAMADLIGVTWTDALAVRIDEITGTGSTIGHVGFDELNSLDVNSSGTFFSVCSSSKTLITINPITGDGTAVANLSCDIPPDVRGLAFDPTGVLFASIDGPGPDMGDLNYLYTIDVATGQCTLIGGTGLTSLQSITFSPSGILYGWEVSASWVGQGGLVTIDPLTGIATDVNPSVGGANSSIQGIAFAPDGTLYGARDSLYEIDPLTGEYSSIGSGGYYDVRGIAYIPIPSTILLLGSGLVGFLGISGKRLLRG